MQTSPLSGTRMQTTRKKIGSALAVFENTISQNKQHGSTESKLFLTGIASSPVKRRWSPRKVSKPKDVSGGEACSVKPKEEEAEQGEDIFNFSLSPKSMSKNKLVKTVSSSSVPSPIASPCSCSTTCVEMTETSLDGTPTVDEDVNAIYGYEDVKPSTFAATYSSPPVSPLTPAGQKSITVQSDNMIDMIRPTRISPTGRGSRMRSPWRRSSIAGEFPSRCARFVCEDRSLIRQDLLMGSDRSPSPTRRSQQNAVRNTVSRGLRAPRRQLSRDDFDPTTVSGPQQPMIAPDLMNDALQKKRSSPKKQSLRLGRFNSAYRKQKVHELTIEAQKYNAADHGLVGILKWEEKPKGLSVRWAQQLTQFRRSSLDLALSDKSSLNDTATRQPRRASMDDMACYSKLNPPFLEDEKKKRATSLLRAAFRASMVLTTFQCNRSRAATKIQAWARGIHERKIYPIRKLERKLVDIEKQRESELTQILHWKWRKMEKIRQKLEAPFKKQEETLKKAQELIRYLRDENSTIEEKNSKISSSMKEMKKMNKHFRDSTKLLLDNLTTMTDAIDTLTEKNTELLHLNSHYESQVREYTAMFNDSNERAAQEKKSRESMEAAIDNIVSTVTLRCGDSALVAEIDVMNEQLRAETPTPTLRPEGLPSFIGSSGPVIMNSTVRSDMSAATFKSGSSSCRSFDTSGSCFSFANVTVDEDQMTVFTNDSSSAWTQ